MSIIAACSKQDLKPHAKTDYYNFPGARELESRLSDEVLLMQGPIESVLGSEVGAADVPPAYWNLVEPQEITRIHGAYAAAGAEVLIANTRGASAPALERDGVDLDVGEVCRAAIDAARAAHPEQLIGAIAPSGVSWFAADSPEYRRARACYREQVHELLTAGVDGVLLESFASIRDLEPALAGARDSSAGMPVLVSFDLDEQGDLTGDGLSVEGAILYAEKHGATAVGADGCSLATASAVVPRMVRAALTPVMIRPGAGEPVVGEEGGLSWDEDPAAFADACLGWRDQGVRLIGGARGTSPRTTAAMAERLGGVSDDGGEPVWTK